MYGTLRINALRSITTCNSNLHEGGNQMGKKINALVVAMLVMMMGVVTIGGVFAANNTTGNMTATAINANAHQPTMISDGHQVYYIVVLGNGLVRPATSAERTAIDVAIADGTVEQSGLEDYLARDLQ